ncbi:uncharacterized protein LOC110229936 [Arabidopsis lyrata subsp. lyrata]|uniref:uncharacterized protein LOC110229936 n=1 Tax=Arabidopsis lyrata subsp. lyrata TaxID=81972 RepID=UPI000A29E48E|nr:uncharacterized protein LOC110229936 [Arabidopsis lyrata subsp. lyrata]|eukprot:XP_020886803.1 uncharacterized protein LOC110229936 [Arabidopsis lyrata subsp. lyrata]
MEQDSDHEVLDLSLAPPNSDAAETPPLGPNLPVAPSSSSSADSNVSQGLSSCTNLPVATSISAYGWDLLWNLPIGASSSIDGLDLSLGSAAAGSPYLGTDISPAITSGSQVASSAQDLPKPPRAINFPMTKITIGDWTQVAVIPNGLKSRCYFGKQQFVWEILDVVETKTKTKRQWKKMEIEWGDVLSLKADVQTGCLDIELRIPPKFFEECDPSVLGHWQKIPHFTEDHPSNFCRRHALHFDPEVLSMNYNKIVADSFWTRRTVEVPFPSLPDSLHFEDGDANLAVGDNSQNASANQSLVPQVIPPSQQMNVRTFT